jgi:alkylation response protein AidB-like acyl-CoA dehydrogenase
LRAEGELRFAMAPGVLAEAGAAGLFRLAVPVDGTRPPSVVELIDVHEELAAADPSVAWAAANSNGAFALLSRFDPAIIPDVLSPDTRFVGVGLPPTGTADVTADGLVVSGRWPVVSGAPSADWFVLHCVLREGGANRTTGSLVDARFVPVPASAVKVEDTWRGVMAVRGSGSNAVSVDQFVVPEDRSIRMVAAATSSEPVDLLNAASPLAVQSLELAALAVGIGRSALAAAIAQAGARISAVSGTGWAEWSSVQNTIAGADMAIETTRAGLHAIAAQAERELSSGDLSTASRARVHTIADHAFRAMRHAVSDLFTVGSVDALRAGHGLEQALRDVHGFSVQWERYRRLQYVAGRALLGADPDDPLF